MFAKKCLNKFTFLPLNKCHDLGVFEDEECLQATPPQLRREAGICGNSANQKNNENKKQKMPGSSNGSPATVSAALLTAVPPLPSHGLKEQLEAASA